MKMSEIRKLNEAETQKKLSELKEELFNLRFRHKTSHIENPMKLRFIRKDIARVKTLINERRLAKN